MSHIFGTDVDFNSNEALQFRSENLLGFPAVGAGDAGRIILHTGLGKFYGWDSAAWIDLGASGGSYVLPTATTSLLGGVKIDGTTITISSGTISATPGVIIEQDDGNGPGYVIAGRNPLNFDPVGFGSFDVSSAFSAGGFGASSDGGFAVGGEHVMQRGASNFGQHMAVGYGNTVGGYYNNMSFGTFNTLTNGYSFFQAGYSNTASMQPTVGHGAQIGMFNDATTHWNVSLGARVQNNWKGTVAVGMANLIDAAGSTDTDRPAFIVGVGTVNSTAGAGYGDVGVRKTGLLVRFDGEVTYPELTTTTINADTTGKAAVTKEWALPKYEVNAAVTTTQNIDWELDTFRYTMTGNTTFTDINLPTSTTNTKVITIYMDDSGGVRVPTWPSGWTTNMTGTYDGTVINQIVVEFISAGVFWVNINRAD